MAELLPIYFYDKEGFNMTKKIDDKKNILKYDVENELNEDDDNKQHDRFLLRLIQKI